MASKNGDQAEEAADQLDWATVRRIAQEVLGLDPENEDAPALARAADNVSEPAPSSTDVERHFEATPSSAASPHPERFAGDRYEVRRHLGDGGTKRVFLVRDTRLDREVALALVRTEGLIARSDGRSRRSRAISDASRARA